MESSPSSSSEYSNSLSSPFVGYPPQEYFGTEMTSSHSHPMPFQASQTDNIYQPPQQFYGYQPMPPPQPYFPPYPVSNSSYPSQTEMSSYPQNPPQYLAHQSIQESCQFSIQPPSELENKSVEKVRRGAYTSFQVNTLMIRFRESDKIGVAERKALAKKLDLTAEQIKIWFQNRRYKLRKMNKLNEENRGKERKVEKNGLPRIRPY